MKHELVSLMKGKVEGFNEIVEHIDALLKDNEYEVSNHVTLKIIKDACVNRIDQIEDNLSGRGEN